MGSGRASLDLSMKAEGVRGLTQNKQFPSTWDDLPTLTVLNMARPSKRTISRRLNLVVANGASTKRRKLDDVPLRDSSPELQASQPITPEADTATEPIPDVQEDVGWGAGLGVIIGPVMIDEIPANVAPTPSTAQNGSGLDGELSDQYGPDEPDDPYVPPEEPPPPVDPRHSTDPLADEHRNLQASVTAVATPFCNAPIPRDVASVALEKLTFILQPSKAASVGYVPPKLDSMFSIRRLGAMAACLHYYCNPELKWSLTYSSKIAALGAGYGPRFGKNLRRFIRAFIITDNIPENQYGTWNSSILEDEDLATELKDYLVECKGRYIAQGQGCQILFLPKFHCELNPIEQCWGYAKRVYRQFPPSKSQAALKTNMLASLDSVPLDTIRRFFNKAHRFLDAYRRGLNGQEAAWANKKYRGHRMLPPCIVQEIEAEFRRHRQGARLTNET